MIREGAHDRVLGFLASNPGLLEPGQVKDKGLNFARDIRAYVAYLNERVAGFRFAKDDFIRGKTAMIALFKEDPFDMNKLKLIQCLQAQIDALLVCSVRIILFMYN